MGKGIAVEFKKRFKGMGELKGVPRIGNSGDGGKYSDLASRDSGSGQRLGPSGPDAGGAGADS